MESAERCRWGVDTWLLWVGTWRRRWIVVLVGREPGWRGPRLLVWGKGRLITLCCYCVGSQSPVGPQESMGSTLPRSWVSRCKCVDPCVPGSIGQTGPTSSLGIYFQWVETDVLLLYVLQHVLFCELWFHVFVATMASCFSSIGKSVSLCPSLLMLGCLRGVRIFVKSVFVTSVKSYG